MRARRPVSARGILASERYFVALLWPVAALKRPWFVVCCLSLVLHHMHTRVTRSSIRSQITRGSIEASPYSIPRPGKVPAPAARPERSAGKWRGVGGYDCKLVRRPPAAFQTDCPICLCILKEPCLISCPCGQKICRECVEQIKKDGEPCPLCNRTEFSFMRDYGLERSLKEFVDVRCASKKDGCEWLGKLGDYEQHLNINPSPENQLTGCQFVEIECGNGCGERFQRRNIASHQNQECKKRPYSCGYCKEHDSTFEDVTQTHYLECKKYPVSCPNVCRDEPFERGELEGHVKDKCPLAEIDCPLHYARCEVRLPRKDMPEHMADTVTHLTLLATVTQSLLKENQELRQTTEDLKKALKKNNKNKHRASITHCLLLETDELKRTTEDLKKENLELKLETDITLSLIKAEVKQLRASKFGFPIEFRVQDNQGTVFLPPFYTHSCGYKLSAEVSLSGTHVSIYTFMMEGDYDDHLKWPFEGVITVQIVNQTGDHSHIEKTILYDDKAPLLNVGGRVLGTHRSGGWGLVEFMPRSSLFYNTQRNTEYWKGGFIVLRVTKVTLL